MSALGANKVLYTRVTPAVYDSVHAQARAEQLTASELVRKAVHDYVERATATEVHDA